ncbi:MAG: ATP-binding cassette domain-containing protein [Eubacterium sp.]|nr:ATP-binding cassette domain-containing protein [Candidatus Colimonas fimequi]
MIASGISKVNLQLDMGEFVVITGESGSGKSTLLNVISGLDTYEEGEMYIDGRQTSHFMEKDFAEYRKKYIGNVFQNFNLVGSYTVYQNIELILLINGYNRQDIKKRVNEILARVDLTSHAKTKASKLSGGQKQRVAIARALAKETDIIVADEPTGNLDSASAEEIVKLLHEISKDKLVIVVTHNYEQFAPYVTRKIKMHDGKIAEDLRVNQGAPVVAEESAEVQATGKPARTRKRATGKISAGSKLRLGLRNTFNVVPKFVLLLIVFTFVCAAVSSQYTSYLAQRAEAGNLGYNSYFINTSLDRIVLKKADNSKFTAEDYESISNVYNVKTVAEYDILLDMSIYLGDDEFYYDVAPRSIDEFKGKLVAGRMPAKPGEVILSGSKDDYNLSGDMLGKNLNREYQVQYSIMERTMKLTVVGIAYKKQADSLSNVTDVYMDNNYLNDIMAETYHDHSDLKVTINKKVQEVYAGDSMYNILPSNQVDEGKIVTSAEVGNYYKDGKATGKNIKVKVSNIYYEKAKELEVQGTYNKKNFDKYSDLDFEMYSGIMFVNPKDYSKFFTHDNYQASVYVQDKDIVDETKVALETLGYVALPIKDVLIQIISDVVAMLQLPIAIIVILGLFFIAYFVIRLILRSRTGYFSILRMLGMNMKAMRRITDVELLVVMTLAYGIFMAVAMLSTYGYIHVEQIVNLVKYMKPVHYGILYGVLLIMSYLISGKFSRSLFKKSAMGTYREVE